MSLKYIKPKNFPPFLDQIRIIDPKNLPITAYARLMCQSCGLWGRAILCPNLLYQTYPQYSTIKKSKEFLYKFNKAYIYIWKNDGTKRWWSKKYDNKHKYVDLVRRKSRQLKGCEAGGAKEIQRFMYLARKKNRKLGYEVETFVTGHCDLCALITGKGLKCPNRGHPPCKRRGLVSMEATGINVYQLLNDLEVEYQYPVQDYITLVSMMVVK